MCVHCYSGFTLIYVEMVRIFFDIFVKHPTQRVKSKHIEVFEIWAEDYNRIL